MKEFEKTILRRIIDNLQKSLKEQEIHVYGLSKVISQSAEELTILIEE